MTAEPQSKLADAAHSPDGPLWRRIIEAFRIAAENVRVRRKEGADVGIHLLDELEDLATKDDRKGDR